jgi:hypothetical protein
MVRQAAISSALASCSASWNRRPSARRLLARFLAQKLRHSVDHGDAIGLGAHQAIPVADAT